MIIAGDPPSSKTVTSFEEALEYFEEVSNRHADKSIYYRGHVDASWKVIPSIFRQVPDISDYESEIIKDLISLFPNEFINDQSMFDRLVRVQHYGLPTRLLDVTINPLTALFFATDPDGDDSVDGSLRA